MNKHNKLILYTNNCPRCIILKTKLDANDIEYTEINNVDKMIEIGITTVPILDVNGEIMNYGNAIKFIDSILTN